MSRISADVTNDQRTGASYYTIRVALPADEIKRLGHLRLIAGMQAEVFVQVNERTPFEYLIKPLRSRSPAPSASTSLNPRSIPNPQRCFRARCGFFLCGSPGRVRRSGYVAK